MTVRQMIKLACDHAGITQRQLAEAMGISPQAFSQKLKKEKFTPSEMEFVAKKLGCSYVSYLEFPDGTRF